MAAPVPNFWFEEIDSTNEEARRRHADGADGPLWIVAAQQTAGKGRSGRRWVSPPGNLYASLMFPLAQSDARAAQLAFVAGVAVHDVVCAFLGNHGRQVLLKWPNDCLIGGAKVSGILCESLGRCAVVGCGINVAVAPEGLPYPVTSLCAEGVAADVSTVFDLLATAMSKRLNQWNLGEGFAAIGRHWVRHAIGIGEAVQVTCGSDRIDGVFEGLGPSGEALLRTRAGLKQVWAGDFAIPTLQSLQRNMA